MKNFLTFITFLIVVMVLGQEVTVQGKLRDSGNVPISFATITFEGVSEDATSFFEVSSNENGAFEAKIQKGEYLVIFQPASGGVEEQEKSFFKDTDLGIIVLDNAVQLAGVMAKGEKPLYRLELDKRVYDMERDPTVRGASLSDALNNVPSVQVDGEGTVSVRGNENIRVLINGKPSAMTGVSNVGDALRNIQADQVERVEVITNPSARYDAEGTGGIINIILKRGTNLGFNASISANVGIPTQNGLNANLNYRTKNWNFFINPYVRYDKPKGVRDFINYEYYDNAPDSIKIQDGERERKRTNYGGSLGFERYLGEKSTLNASVNMRRSLGDNENATGNFTYAEDQLVEKSLRLSVEDEIDKDIEGVLGFSHKFNKKGHKLDIQTSGSWAEEDEITDISEKYSVGSLADYFERNLSFEQQRRWLAQADYVLPYAENARFEFGVKGEWLTNINDYGVEILENNIWNFIDASSDKVEYSQDVLAVYTQYGNRMGKFSYLLGLRMENSDIGIISASANNGAGSNDKKNYTNWFPSATLNYFVDKDEETQVQLSYSKRIQRPRNRFLSPFQRREDDYNRFQGNTDLDPVISQAFELSLITQIRKITLTPSVYYQESDDPMTIYRKATTDVTTGQRYFLAQPINLDGTEKRYGAELVASAQLDSWWRIFGNLNFFQYESNGIYFDKDLNETIDLSGDGFSWFGRISNNIKLPAKTDFQVNAFYFGGQKNAQMERDPIWSLDLALSKDILKGNGTLSFNVRDIFNTRRRKVHNFGPNYDSYIDLQWRPRQFTLNFTYRINQKKNRERGAGNRGEGGDGMEM